MTFTTRIRQLFSYISHLIAVLTNRGLSYFIYFPLFVFVCAIHKLNHRVKFNLHLSDLRQIRGNLANRRLCVYGKSKTYRLDD